MCGAVLRSVLQNCRRVPFKGPRSLGGSRLKGPSKDRGVQGGRGEGGKVNLPPYKWLIHADGSANLIRPKGLSRFSGSKYNPYTLRAARRPCLYALAMPAPPPITRVATLSSLLTGTMGPKGIKWDPRGDPRAPSAPFGGMGPGGPLGLFRSHSEWKAISNGKQLRMEGHSEIKAIS